MKRISPRAALFRRTPSLCGRAAASSTRVVTMYHDQGQIAMKLLGFERGVTVHGGLPTPITTPAHGTAFDIVGQGVANPEALKQALGLCAQMLTPASAVDPPAWRMAR